MLPYLVQGYNRRIHSAHGFPPSKVNHKNQYKVIEALYPPTSHSDMTKAMQEPFNVGDYVRIPKYKHIFEKGYLPNWTREIFIIASKQFKAPRMAYYLKDLTGEEIKGRFYSEQLQKVHHLPEFHLVEKIVKTKRNSKTGKKEYLIKWLGYPEKMNSWVTEEDIKELTELTTPVN